MANQQAPRDENQVSTLLAIDDTTGETVPVAVDSDGNLLVVATVSGGVTGPATSTLTAVAKWADITGDTLSDSGVLIDASDNVTGVGNITGKSGGITITGGTASGNDLTLTSTSHATKGSIFFGGSTLGVFDETVGRLSMGGEDIMVVGGTTVTSRFTADLETGASGAEYEAHRHSDTASVGAVMYGARSRGTKASPSVVQSGDNLLDLVAVGYDGTDYEQAARIDMEVDGTPGSNDMPGRIVFRVSADGSQSPSESSRVNSSGTMFANGKAIMTSQTAADTLLIQAYDVDNTVYTTFATLTANNTPTMDLSDSVTKNGSYIYRAGGTDIPVTDGGTGASDASGARTNLGLGTIATQAANSVSISGGSITGITDLALADGGTGASLSDPNADRIMFWDDSAGAVTWLTVGTGLSITDTTISSSSSSTPRRNLNIVLDAAHLTLTGTNPTDVTTMNGIQCSTNIDNGSSAASVTVQTEANWDFYDKDPEINVNIYYSAGSATGNGKIYCGDTTDSFSPTETQTTKSMFIFADTVAGTITWYAVNANGTTNTNSSLAGITSAQENLWRVVKNSTTNIKWYVNYTLKATHTTNLPSGDTAAATIVVFGVDNDAGDTTTRTARFGFMDVLLNSPTD